MLEARGLQKTYGKVEAVKHIVVAAAPGSIVGLVGNNGAGKTTTIKMLCGLVEPTAGEVRVGGHDPQRPETRRNLGFLPEESPLYDDMKPLAYLRYFGRLYGMSRADIKQRATALLQRLRLDESHWSKPIGQLSKGSARKVAIARALLHEPRLLILDEPRSGLDPATQHVLDGLLLELRDAGVAIVLSAHDLDQVERLCDVVLVVQDGEIALRGTLDELRERAGPSTYLVTANAAFDGSQPEGSHHVKTVGSWEEAEAIGNQIRKAGATVLDVRAQAPRLADVLQ